MTLREGVDVDGTAGPSKLTMMTPSSHRQLVTQSRPTNRAVPNDSFPHSPETFELAVSNDRKGADPAVPEAEVQRPVSDPKAAHCGR